MLSPFDSANTKQPKLYSHFPDTQTLQMCTLFLILVIATLSPLEGTHIYHYSAWEKIVLHFHDLHPHSAPKVSSVWLASPCFALALMNANIHQLVNPKSPPTFLFILDLGASCFTLHDRRCS